jgi:hypothetical protein
VLPESLVRRLIRKKISSKYEILKEAGDPWGKDAKKKSDARKDRAQRDKENKEKLDNLKPGGDKSKKTGQVMPDELVKEMEADLQGEEANAKIKIYDQYMAMGNPSYNLPDNHQKIYDSLVQGADDAGTLKFHTKMFRVAEKLKDEAGIVKTLEKFDDLAGAVASTRQFALEILELLDAEPNNSVFDNNVAMIKFRANIKDNPEDYGITDVLAKSRIGERSKTITKDFISAIITKDNLERLLSKTKLEVQSGFKLQGKPIDLSNYGIGDLFYGSDSSQYHKRLAGLIKVLFVPKNNGNVIAKSLKDLAADKDAIGQRDDEDVVALYKSNVSVIESTFEKLKAVYEGKSVDEQKVKDCYQGWYELIEADSSDLILCRMMALLLSQEVSGFTDWGQYFDDIDEDIANIDINNPRILFKAVKASMAAQGDYSEQNAQIGWYEIAGAHLGAMGQNVKGKTDSTAYLETAYETIGMALYGIWLMNFNKSKAQQFFSPDDVTFVQGEEKEYKGGTLQREWEKTKNLKKHLYNKWWDENTSEGGSGQYYEVMKEILTVEPIFSMMFATRDFAQKSIAQVSKGVYRDAGEKVGASGLNINITDTEEKEEKTDPQESKIFRSKDGSKILVERKDLRKIIKALKNSRRK